MAWPQAEGQGSEGDEQGAGQRPLDSRGQSARSLLLDRGEAGVLRGNLDLCGIHLVRAAGISGEQGLVGQDVDASRQPLGGLGDHLDRTRRERVGPVVTGGAQTELDVAADFGRLEWRQVEVLGDALAKLPHVVGGEALVEFRLGEEGDLQEFGGLGL